MNFFQLEHIFRRRTLVLVGVVFRYCWFSACSKNLGHQGLFPIMEVVAARLRSLRTNDPLNKGHPRSIEKEIELCQAYFRN